MRPRAVGVLTLLALFALVASVAPAAAEGGGPIVAARPSMHVPEAVLLNEGFEDTTFPPTGWATFNVDGGGTQWVRSTTPHTGTASAYHQYSSAGAQDGWLITPQLTLLGGVSSLVFWQRDTYSLGSWYDYHGVLITTDADPNPATATYIELWEADIGTTWTETTIDLSAYAGQQVYIAFRYTGDDADDWRIDDVVVNSEGQVAAGQIDVDPLSMASTQPPDTTTQQTLTIANTGDGDLAWTIAEQPGAPEAVVSFVLDDGVEENNIGIGGTAQFIFLNRFTPPASFYPIVLNEIQVYFATDGLAQVGDDMLLAIYENTSGNSDPAVGSNLLATLPVTVSALDAWNSYTLAVPVTFNGPGDVLLGVIALEVPGTTYWPAALDQTASQQRSWAGWWSTPTAPTPPTLPPDEDWTLIDAFFPGNWLVRGYGETNAPCLDPADVPWLSVAPTAGTTAPAASTPVDVTLDSTGLAAGIYLANLCVASDDPDPGPGNGTELVVVPVELTVEATGTASISLVKTVGTVDGVCAATSNLTVAPGTTVYYCYTVTNTGDVTLNSHDLVDDQLGTIFTGLSYALTPGSSVSTVAAGLSIPFVVNAPVTNVATWTAYESSTGGVSATTAGTATVTVEDLPSVLEIPTLGAAGASLLGLALAGLGLGALRRRRG